MSVRQGTCVLAVLAGLLGTLAAAGPASARVSSLPNPCTLLSAAKAGAALGMTVSGTVGKLETYGSGTYEILQCKDTVGSMTVFLSTENAIGGFGGVRIISRSKPAGLGSEATLIEATAMTSSAAIDILSFHRGGVWVSLTVHSGTPTGTLNLGKAIYKLI